MAFCQVPVVTVVFPTVCSPCSLVRLPGLLSPCLSSCPVSQHLSTAFLPPRTSLCISKESFFSRGLCVLSFFVDCDGLCDSILGQAQIFRVGRCPSLIILAGQTLQVGKAKSGHSSHHKASEGKQLHVTGVYSQGGTAFSWCQS